MQARKFLIAIALSFFSALSAADSRDLTGRYRLHGAMEMAAELLLRKDGTFAGGVAYGSAQGYAKGIWQIEGGAVHLQSDAANAPRVPGDIDFDIRNSLSLEQMAEYRHYDSERGDKLAKNNYVLEIKHDEFVHHPTINPVNVLLEFSDGAVNKMLWRGGYEWRLSSPFDERRVLKRIGFHDEGGSGATQWFEFSATARWLGFDWKKKPGRKLSFEYPFERNLAEAERYYKNNPEELEHIKSNYLITMYYDDELVKPKINPVNVYWEFEGGSVQKDVWDESKQSLALLPYKARRKLQKIGFQEQGSTRPIQWLEVSPAGRWFSVYWKGHSPGQDDDLSMLFNDMALEIKPNCLVLDLGTGKACFRK